MTAFRVRILLLAFATGAVLGQSFTAHAAAVDSGVSVCGVLREGESLGSLESTLLAQGFSERAAGIYTGAAVRAECPDLVGYVMGQIA